MANITRNQEHYVIMTVIYDELTDFIYGDKSSFRDAHELTASLLEVESYEEVSPFVDQMIAQSLTNYGKIVAAYTPFLKNWKWDRLPTLTQAVLIMTYAHFYFVEKVDKKVVINIAVNLAKKYIDVAQAKFINAILEKVIQ